MTDRHEQVRLIRQAMAQGQWPLVEKLAQPLLSSRNTQADGNYFLGLVALNTNRVELAIQLFKKSQQLEPNRYDAAIELCDVSLNSRDYDTAKAILASLQIEQIKDGFYLFKAGKCWQRLNDFNAAFDCFVLAFELAPEQAQIQIELARVATNIGKLELAKQTYQTLLKQFPNNQQLHYEIAMLSTAMDDKHITQMLALSHSVNSNKVFLNSALGKEYEDLADWKNAFYHYKACADEAKRLSKYDVQQDLTLIEALKQSCSDVVDHTATVLSEDRVPIFLTGLPRSGTTLLDKILAGHSEIQSIDESFFYTAALQSACGHPAQVVPTSDVIRAAAKVEKSDIAKRYLALVNHRLGEEKYFIEKLPENFLYIGFIAASFPSAKIIFVERHPLDLCFALYKQPYFRYAYDLKDLAQFYLAATDLIATYKGLLGDRLVTVKYEDLVQQPVETIEKLFGHMAIDFEAQCMNFESRTSSSSSASKSQIRQPIHTRSVAKWRKFEQQLSPLIETLKKYGVEV